jgi:hypothetical protein
MISAAPAMSRTRSTPSPVHTGGDEPFGEMSVRTVDLPRFRRQVTETAILAGTVRSRN